MSTIEGGMITTNNRKFYNTCLLKRSHGLARELPEKEQGYFKKKYSKNDFKFLFLSSGYNLRSTEINAFLGIIMLKKINQWIKIRNDNFIYFIDILKQFNGEFTMSYNKEMSSFVLPFLMKSKNKKKLLESYLNKNGIETRPFIAGNLLRQPFLKNFKNKIFKNSDFIHTNAFYIGNNQFLNKSRLDKLHKLLNRFFY